jgi:hypothetical protein
MVRSTSRGGTALPSKSSLRECHQPPPPFVPAVADTVLFPLRRSPNSNRLWRDSGNRRLADKPSLDIGRLLFFAGGTSPCCCPPSFHQLGKSLASRWCEFAFLSSCFADATRFSLYPSCFCCGDSFALVAADIPFPPVLDAERDKAVPRSEARRFSKVPIWRRIKSASSSDLRDMSMSCG